MNTLDEARAALARFDDENEPHINDGQMIEILEAALRAIVRESSPS